MTYVDLSILLVMALAVFGGFSRGFLRTFCSLLGLVAGLILAAWNFKVISLAILPFMRLEPVADMIGFILIVISVMAVSSVLGKILSQTLHKMGLGCLDRLAGAAFGFFEGVMMITIVMIISLAFFPESKWLAHSRLPKRFMKTCNLSLRYSPDELADRVRLGLLQLEKETPDWMHPTGKV